MNFFRTLKKSLVGNKFIKLILFLGFIGLIYFQLSNRNDWLEVKEGYYQSLKHLYVGWFVLFLVLMPMNWLLEAIKWQIVVKQRYVVGLWLSFKTILAGVSLAIVTPNRIGDYGGRLMVIPAEYNWISVVSTFIGSVCQNIVTIFFGIIGLYMLTNYQTELFPFDIRGVLLLCFLVLICLVYLFFKINILAGIGRYLGLNRFLSKFRKPYQLLRDLPRHTIWKVLGVAVIRFLLYSFQYYCVIRFFGIHLGFVQSFSCIWSIYIVQSGIPLPPFLSVLARGEIAILIWSLFSINELSILTITFIIWLVNLMLPALIGMIYILRANILASLGYDND